MTDDIRVIEISFIDEPPTAMRSDINREEIERLAENIRANGLINPITVRPVGDRFQVVAGHRRLLACRVAPLWKIPCVVRELDDAKVFDIMSAENLAREDVDPVDQAIHIGRLVGDDESKIPEIAKRLRYSVEWVKSRLEILDYPDIMLPYIKTGELKLGVAQELARIGNVFWLEQYVNQAVKQGMSILQAKYLRAQFEMGLMLDPTAPLPDGSDLRNSTPQLMKAICSRCERQAIEPNLTLVYVHKECPADMISPS